MRIALIHPAEDPTSPRHWSGIPHGLSIGLAAHGHTVVPVGVSRQPWRDGLVAAAERLAGRRGLVASAGPIAGAVRTAVLRRAVAAAGPLDAVLATGTEWYDLPRVVPPGVPAVTYDDATFVLAERNPVSDFNRLIGPAAERARWVDRQARGVRFATACCVCSSWAARSLVEDYGLPASKIHVVGMGHRPRPPPAAKDWSVPRVLFIGTDWTRKNGDAVLAAFATVRNAHPAATLDLVGDHPAVDRPGVTGHGHLPRENADAQQKLDRLIAAATVFVMPSAFEPFGLVYLEAASAGLAVIGTTEGGAASLLDPAMLAVRPDDPAGLVAAMTRLADPEEARRRGRIAAAHAATFTWEAVSGRIAACIAAAAAEPQSFARST